MFSLFRKKQRQSAVDRIETRINSIDRSSPEVSDTLYCSVFGAALSFYQTVHSESDLPEGYKSDGFIFEFTAYLMFRADVYLFTTYPPRRQLVINTMHEQATAIFNDSFGTSDEELFNLLDDRMAFYAPLVQSGADPMAVHTTVLQAVHDTASNSGIPRLGLANRFTPASALDEFQIKIKMPQWELNRVKILHELFDNLYQ